jgi:hypothetical protein
MEFPRLTTARLVLRQFALSDAAEVQRLAGDRAIADTTLEIPHPYEDGMAEQWIATHAPKFEAGEQVALAITLADTGRLVGAVGLAVQARFDRAEIGYWVGKPYWGRGLGLHRAQAQPHLCHPLQRQPRLGSGDAEARYDRRRPPQAAHQEVGSLRRSGDLRPGEKRMGRLGHTVIGWPKKHDNWTLTPSVFLPKLSP